MLTSVASSGPAGGQVVSRCRVAGCAVTVRSWYSATATPSVQSLRMRSRCHADGVFRVAPDAVVAQGGKPGWRAREPVALTFRKKYSRGHLLRRGTGFANRLSDCSTCQHSRRQAMQRPADPSPAPAHRRLRTAVKVLSMLAAIGASV